MEDNPEECFNRLQLSSLKIRAIGPRLSQAKGNHQTLFVGLLLQLSLNQRRIIDGYQNRDISLLGWGTRNILELSVWTEFAVASDENAKRLCDEMMMDGSNIVQVGTKIAKLVPNRPGLAKLMKDSYDAFKPILDASGIDENDSYLRFKQIVKETYPKDVHETFCIFHHFLSKFVHPTAYLIMGNHSEDSVFPPIGKSLFQSGTDYSVSSVDFIERYLLQRE